MLVLSRIHVSHVPLEARRARYSPTVLYCNSKGRHTIQYDKLKSAHHISTAITNDLDELIEYFHLFTILRCNQLFYERIKRVESLDLPARYFTGEVTQLSDRHGKRNVNHSLPQQPEHIQIVLLLLFAVDKYDTSVHNRPLFSLFISRVSIVQYGETLCSHLCRKGFLG